ncbi:hypothetical protein CPter291_0208 [Collimonas pratensis]|uniref:Uncharacterized protein n=1 Tax=Collimonas pratensis TaxID=279113 RepID=A0ABN4M7F8_9BURK|nr:hypothetical protein CPter291_0208 [Collimonas pratensis]
MIQTTLLYRDCSCTTFGCMPVAVHMETATDIDLLLIYCLFIVCSASQNRLPHRCQFRFRPVSCGLFFDVTYSK